MLRIMLPGIVARTICNISVAVYVGIAIGVVYERIVVVDVDVVVPSPSAVPAPPTAECGAHHHADSK